MRRILALLLSGILLISCSCLPVSASDDETALIDGFRGYKWRTAADEIVDAETTETGPESREDRDSRLQNMKQHWEGFAEVEGDLSAFLPEPDEVAGYQSQIAYLFYDEKLIGGVYGINVSDDQEEAVYEDLVSKYSSVYGDPIAEKPDNGWGRFTLWADSRKDFVFLNGFFNIIYLHNAYPVETILEFYNGNDYFNVDVLAEVNKVGNISGI